VTPLYRYALTALLCCSTLAAADLKIKSRETLNLGGNTRTTENARTVYFQGPRARDEWSFGKNAGGLITITQCDLKRVITVLGGNQCVVVSLEGGDSCLAKPEEPAPLADGKSSAPHKGGVATVTNTTTDTGERQEMFGYETRHLKTSSVWVSTPDACNRLDDKIEADGWYAELSPNPECEREVDRAMACFPQDDTGCVDRVVLQGDDGSMGLYAMKSTVTHTSKTLKMVITNEVVEVTSTTLDPSLFEMPPGCRVAESGNRVPHPSRTGKVSAP